MIRFGSICDIDGNVQMILNEFGQIAYDEWMKLPERFANVALDVFQIMPNHMHGIIVLQNAPPDNTDDNNVNNAHVGAGLAPALNNVGDNMRPDPNCAGAGASPAPTLNNMDVANNANTANNGGDNNMARMRANDNNADDMRMGVGARIVGGSRVGAGASPAPTLGDMANNGDDNGAGPAPTVGNIVGAYKSLVATRCLKEIANVQNIALGKLWQRNFYEHIIRNEQSYQSIADYIINNPGKWNEDKFFTE